MYDKAGVTVTATNIEASMARMIAGTKSPDRSAAGAAMPTSRKEATLSRFLQGLAR